MDLKQMVLDTKNIGNISQEMLVPRNQQYPGMHYMLHPMNVENPTVFAIFLFYTLICFIGLCGDASVLAVIKKSWPSLLKSGDNGFLYIVSLCIVDFVVILTMSMTICEILVANWILGVALCKVYWAFESAGKVLSGFILSALSFDRYMAVCHPFSRKYRSRWVTISIILALVLTTLILVSPLPLHATVVHEITRDMHLVYGVPTQFVHIQCSTSSFERKMFNAFTSYMFILGFCIPAFCIVTSYGLMVWKLRVRTRAIKQSSIPWKKISIYTLFISVFYFACWGPYWAGTFLYIFKRGSESNSGHGFVYVMYLIHALPYVNSAFNWVFYVALNTQFQGVGTVSRNHTNAYTSIGTGRKNTKSCSPENNLCVYGSIECRESYLFRSDPDLKRLSKSSFKVSKSGASDAEVFL